MKGDKIEESWIADNITESLNYSLLIYHLNPLETDYLLLVKKSILPDTAPKITIKG